MGEYKIWGATGIYLRTFFINDIFYFIDNDIKLFNYADDNTLVFSHPNKNIMVSRLEQASRQVIDWFCANGIQANPGKFQSLYLYRNETENIYLNLDCNSVCSEDYVKLLGMLIDKNLTFEISHK